MLINRDFTVLQSSPRRGESSEQQTLTDPRQSAAKPGPLLACICSILSSFIIKRAFVQTRVKNKMVDGVWPFSTKCFRQSWPPISRVLFGTPHSPGAPKSQDRFATKAKIAISLDKLITRTISLVLCHYFDPAMHHHRPFGANSLEEAARFHEGVSSRISSHAATPNVLHFGPQGVVIHQHHYSSLHPLSQAPLATFKRARVKLHLRL